MQNRFVLSAPNFLIDTESDKYRSVSEAHLTESPLLRF